MKLMLHFIQNKEELCEPIRDLSELRCFYWPPMQTDIERYVRKCVAYQKVEYDRHKTPKLLQPLPFPNASLESISMDFIVNLPRTHVNGAIWTIIYRSKKQAHLLPICKIELDHTTRLLAHIFKYHGMPKLIVGDRDPCPTILFDMHSLIIQGYS